MEGINDDIFVEICTLLQPPDIAPLACANKIFAQKMRKLSARIWRRFVAEIPLFDYERDYLGKIYAEIGIAEYQQILFAAANNANNLNAETANAFADETIHWRNNVGILSKTRKAKAIWTAQIAIVARTNSTIDFQKINFSIFIDDICIANAKFIVRGFNDYMESIFIFGPEYPIYFDFLDLEPEKYKITYRCYFDGRKFQPRIFNLCTKARMVFYKNPTYIYFDLVPPISWFTNKMIIFQLKPGEQLRFYKAGNNPEFLRAIMAHIKRKFSA